ncbi:MAG: HD domain-containing protein [Prevotellaceae bacterium]|nr:HD domain-containing protein [Prevotellaceae bacterium]
MNNPSLDLMQFIEQQILPQYAQFDKAHQLSHANSVIKNSIEIANNLGANIDMAYVVAAYHDLGLSGPRAIHHITSGKILAADKRLQKWFSTDEIRIMKEAVEDHRASSSRSPRSIYGKIVAEADRDLTPEVVIRRTIQFGLANYPEKDKEQHFQRLKAHLDEKYSVHGYIKLWIQQSPNQTKLRQLHELIDNEPRLRELFETIYKEETSVQQ